MTEIKTAEAQTINPVEAKLAEFEKAAQAAQATQATKNGEALSKGVLRLDATQQKFLVGLMATDAFWHPTILALVNGTQAGIVTAQIEARKAYESAKAEISKPAEAAKK
jgi:hypothetical protein